MTGTLPVVLAPSFPRRADASDGQSVYVVEAAHALAARVGTRLRAIALRLGDEPRRESDGAIDIERIDPGARIESPFALYEASHFEQAMERLAEAARGRVPAGAPALVHGYELGPTAARLAAQGHRVVAVLHYLLAQESARYLAGAADPFRRAAMPPVLARVGALLPGRARVPFVRTASLASGWVSRSVPIPRLGASPASVVVHQLRKLALERTLIGSADVVVGVSAGFAADIGRFYPRAHVVHCHAGHPEDVRPAPWAPASRLRLLSVGRPTPQKGWDVLARALALLDHEQPTLAARIELTLVGGAGAWAGPHSAFGARTRELLLALRHVSFHDAGRLSRAAVLAAYGAADVFVLPSDYEPFGLVLLEAMAAGCPVLAFATDGPSDVLGGSPQAQAAGWCLPRVAWPERARALADAIAGLLALDADAWRARRAAARTRAESFTWARTAEAHDRLLRPAG